MIQETSRESYQELMQSDRLNELQRQVFTAFFVNPLSTDKEISIESGIDINIVTARRNELVTEGLIEECEKRICSFSGKTALTWKVCDKASLIKGKILNCLSNHQMDNLWKTLFKLRSKGTDYQKSQIKEWVSSNI